MSEGRRWVSVKQASEYFSIPAGTLYSLLNRDRLPAGSVVRLGRALRVNVEAIEKGAALDVYGRRRGCGGSGAILPRVCGPRRLLSKGGESAEKT